MPCPDSVLIFYGTSLVHVLAYLVLCIIDISDGVENVCLGHLLCLGLLMPVTILAKALKKKSTQT
jgi:hypothetical protein